MNERINEWKEEGTDGGIAKFIGDSVYFHLFLTFYNSGFNMFYLQLRSTFSKLSLLRLILSQAVFWKLYTTCKVIRYCNEWVFSDVFDNVHRRFPWQLQNDYKWTELVLKYALQCILLKFYLNLITRPSDKSLGVVTVCNKLN